MVSPDYDISFCCAIIEVFVCVPSHWVFSSTELRAGHGTSSITSTFLSSFFSSHRFQVCGPQGRLFSTDIISSFLFKPLVTRNKTIPHLSCFPLSLPIHRQVHNSCFNYLATVTSLYEGILLVGKTQHQLHILLPRAIPTQLRLQSAYDPISYMLTSGTAIYSMASHLGSISVLMVDTIHQGLLLHDTMEYPI